MMRFKLSFWSSGMVVVKKLEVAIAKRIRVSHM